MPSVIPGSSFRLPPETTLQIREIAEAKDGLTYTRVVELAIDAYHRTICRPVTTTAPTKRTRDAKER